MKTTSFINKLTILPTVSLALVLLLAACGEKEAKKSEEPFTAVETVAVAASSVPDTYEAVGTVHATVSSALSPKVVGNVTSVLVSEGDRVRKGQLLLTIDDRDVMAQHQKALAGVAEVENAIAAAEAAKQAATANATLAEKTYGRYQELRERRSVSPQEFDEVEARYRAAAAGREQAESTHASLLSRRNQARADVDSTQAYVSYTRIVSPVDGVVTAKSVELGQQVAPGMPLLTVESEGNWRVDAQVEENLAGSIRPGDAAVVVIDAAGLRLEGVVRHVSPALDLMSRSYVVKIDLPPDAALRSGLFARVAFRTGQREAITIPRSAMVDRGQLSGVWAVDGEGLARLRYVRTGRQLGDSIEVLSGLGSGDRIIVAPGANIEEGLKVAPAGQGVRS